MAIPHLTSGVSGPQAIAGKTPSVPLSDAAIAAGLGLLGLMSGRKKTPR
ncbi:MAG: hypothetical protein V4508_10965 [Pseudomonadota bacterium]